MMETLLRRLTTKMVTTPSKVKVNEIDTLDGRKSLGIKCAPEDYRHLIGANARTIRALQLIFRVIGKQQGYRQQVSISVEMPKEKNSDRPRIGINENWSEDKSTALDLTDVLDQTGFRSTVAPETAGNHTVFKVFPSRPVPKELADAIKQVFQVIGRINGRIIEVDV